MIRVIRMGRAGRQTWRAKWPVMAGRVGGSHRGVYVRVGSYGLFAMVRRAPVVGYVWRDPVSGVERTLAPRDVRLVRR